MIQGRSNDNYLTLQERITVASGYTILVRFISEDTLVDTTTLPVTISGSHAYRYHKLIITEKDAATEAERRSGSVTLNPYGTMLYEVYQTTATVQACDYLAVIPMAEFIYPMTVYFIKNGETVEGGVVNDQGEFGALVISFGFSAIVVGEISINVGRFISPDDWESIHLVTTEDTPIEFVQSNCQDIGISLDYTLADVLLETGKCLVTKATGFDSFTEYTGATS